MSAPEAPAGEVRVTVDAGVAHLTIENPPVNALSRTLLDRLEEAVRRAAGDPEVGVLVLTGGGEKAFAAGADIRELAALDPIAAHAHARRGQEVFLGIERLGKPVLAAVNGWALGGGCELAMACHVRIASTRAVFGQPEVALGVIPGFGGTQRLPRLVGKGRAHEWLLTGDRIDAAEAFRIGLANRVVAPEQLLAECGRIAALILSRSRSAVALALQAVEEGASLPLEEALAHEAALFARCFATDDMREGTRAFLEKRPPRFARS